MAIVFNKKTGQLDCRYFKPRQSVCMNLVRDGAFSLFGEGYDTYWKKGSCTIVGGSSSDQGKYGGSGCAINLPTQGNYIYQQIPGMVNGHKYVFFVKVLGNKSLTAALKSAGSASSGTTYWSFVQQPFYTGMFTVLKSDPFTYSQSNTSPYLVLSASSSSGSNLQICKVALADLNWLSNVDTANMPDPLEFDMIQFTTWMGNSYNTLRSIDDFEWVGSNSSIYQYPNLTSDWEPHTFMFYISPKATSNSARIGWKIRNAVFTTNYPYYTFMEARGPEGSTTSTVLFEVEPASGGIYMYPSGSGGKGISEPPHADSLTGSANGWKRLSLYHYWESKQNPSYSGTTTGALFINYQSTSQDQMRTMGMYSYHYTDIANAVKNWKSRTVSTTSINKSFCDRYIGDPLMPLLHFPQADPRIIFSKDGDITCIDIDINGGTTSSAKMVLNKDGTMDCYKLYQNNPYFKG